MDHKKIVVGKNISTTAAGYVPLSTDMVTYVEEAFARSGLKDWAKYGGVSVWVYKPTTTTSTNTEIINYFTAISTLTV